MIPEINSWRFFLKIIPNNFSEDFFWRFFLTIFSDEFSRRFSVQPGGWQYIPRGLFPNQRELEGFWCCRKGPLGCGARCPTGSRHWFLPRKVLLRGSGFQTSQDGSKRAPWEPQESSKRAPREPKRPQESPNRLPHRCLGIQDCGVILSSSPPVA